MWVFDGTVNLYRPRDPWPRSSNTWEKSRTMCVTDSDLSVEQNAEIQALCRGVQEEPANREPRGNSPDLTR
ncbi:hypothetical protein Rleg_0193 [Rhizobium leguminosarum bv. trifolii WSM1325]|uniref:Uncharacterized protein n=1 Tax=Rhizobium leguminosarum bv. trifolii (strain WSM1325) TaxID=395491 RepID=C6B085_RHILS|nr:hypothetical protein Rleg_0193 [Rhizobium leguminosarum bv. trifolii WSM1325]